MSLVEENNELLLNLISDILDISKIEAGTVELIITRVDVARLCREVISTCSHKKHEEAVGLRFDESSPQIMVDADKNRIMQVLSNFITNALKFTTKGSVTLSYRLEDDGLLVLPTSASKITKPHCGFFPFCVGARQSTRLREVDF